MARSASILMRLMVLAAFCAAALAMKSTANMAALEADMAADETDEWHPETSKEAAKQPEPLNTVQEQQDQFMSKQADPIELVQQKAGGLPGDAEQTAFAEGSDFNNPTSLFPGPTYGLPGYKESHDWVDDTDLFSPLIFNWRYYKAKCKNGCSGEVVCNADGKTENPDNEGVFDIDCTGDPLDGMNEGQVKKYWVDKGMDNNEAASASFDCNFYVQSHEDLKADEDLWDAGEGRAKCKNALNHFLTSGIFDGLGASGEGGGGTFEGTKVSNANPQYGGGDSPGWHPRAHYCPSADGCAPNQIKWTKNFAWTFWFIRTQMAPRRDLKVMPVMAVRADYKYCGGSRWWGQGTTCPIKVPPDNKDVYPVRNPGWWGGFPLFVSWAGSMMFCASTERWNCHWPIGAENSGVKGGWRFNWYHRWRLPPLNWWRFYGVMADEDGYTLYEYNDPKVTNTDYISKPGVSVSGDAPNRWRGWSHWTANKHILSRNEWGGHAYTHPSETSTVNRDGRDQTAYKPSCKNWPYDPRHHWSRLTAVHGFARRIPSKAKGSWWGRDWHQNDGKDPNYWWRFRSDLVDHSAIECEMGTCPENAKWKGWWSHDGYRNTMRMIEQHGSEEDDPNKDNKDKPGIETCSFCGYYNKDDETYHADPGDGREPRLYMPKWKTWHYRGHETMPDYANSWKVQLSSCMCHKKWADVAGLNMLRGEHTAADATIWTGYTYQQRYVRHNWWWLWSMHSGPTPQVVMDLTYYAFPEGGPLTMSESQFEALYLAGRSDQAVLRSQAVSTCQPW